MQRIIDALKNATNADPSTFYNVDWAELEIEWAEYIEYIQNKGVLIGLSIAKKAWDKGFGRNDIHENEIHYNELVKEVEEQFIDKQ